MSWMVFKKRRYPIAPWAIILCLLMINLCIQSTYPYTNIEEQSGYILRPAASKNGAGGPHRFKPVTPPRLETERYPKVKDAVDTVVVPEGIVEVIRDDGTRILVPAGTTLLPGARIPVRSSVSDVERLGDEFGGMPLDRVIAQITVSHEIALGRSQHFGRFKSNKVIELNTDLLPDPGEDENMERLVTGILETIARRVLAYRRDNRFSMPDNKIYIELISREGDAEGKSKRDAIVALFKGLDYVKRYELDKILFSETEVGKVEGFNRLTITYRQDGKPFFNPVLLLSEKTVVQDIMAAYPWGSIMDLALDILSLDRGEPQKTVRDSIKAIFEDLLKREIPDEELDRFLSNDLIESINAATTLVLPPIEKIDFRYLDEINAVMQQVAESV